MPAPPPTPLAADRNLLFGILALQMDFVSRDALIAAMHAWVLDKAAPLGEILVRQGALGREEHALLEALVQKHLARHDNDAAKSLAAVGSVGPVLNDLKQIADPDLDASLAHVAAAPPAEDDPHATQPEAAGTPSSSGLRFRILRPHAKGGLGEVFVARDEELHREVALKQIQDRHADQPESRARFLLEAEVTGGLEHPGIVPVYGLGQYADGRPFYAMRFIRGDSLKDAIARFHADETLARDPGKRGLELRGLLGRFVDVCNAIEYAHSRGVLHRDLKPANVMLGSYGETLVVDWGLAKPTGKVAEGVTGSQEDPLRPSSASGSHTLAGPAMGTPQYMSPEQAMGRLDVLGPASDVYSLGATLYCLLTGRPPVTDADVGTVLHKVQTGDFPPPRKVKPDVPAALEAVCLKAMALLARERYPSPGPLARDVERWLADEPVSAWREPWAVRAGRWVRRHRTLVTAGVAALVVAAVTLGAGAALLARANEQLREANQREGEARQEVYRRKYISDLPVVQLEWEKARIEHLLELLEAQQPERTGGKDLRGFEWHYWWRLCHQELHILKGHTGPVRCVAFSRDGTRLASASSDQTVKVWDAQTGLEILQLKGHTGSVYSVAFRPDGKRLASASEDKTVRVWDAETGQEVLQLPGHADRITSVVFSPDGQRLASASEDETVRVWDAANGQEKHQLKGHTKHVISVVFSPDGQRLASASEDETVRVWDAANGQDALTLTGHMTPTRLAGYVYSVVFSPDGTRLASASYDQTVRVWDTQTGQEILRLQGHTGPVMSVAFSPDGKRLASASGDRIVRLWDAQTGQEALTLKGHTGGVLGVAFSPDGERLASAGEDGTVRVWKAAGNVQEPRTLTGHRNPVKGVAFSSDDRMLATASSDHTVKLWDTDTGKVLHTLQGHGDEVYAVAFSPDHMRLATASWDKTVKVWDVASGRETLVFPKHNAKVWAVAFSTDGKRLASAGDDRTVRIWDADTGGELLTLGHDTVVSGVAFSHDGTRLASAGWDKRVRIWDLASGREALMLPNLHTEAVWAVAFSPDGERLVSASNDQTVRVWDARTGQALQTLYGHDREVSGVAFSPDGKRLATASWDRTVKVWDTTSWAEVLTLKGHTKDVFGVAFSSDGLRIASTSDDTTVRLWDAGPKERAR